MKSKESIKTEAIDFIKAHDLTKEEAAAMLKKAKEILTERVFDIAYQSYMYGFVLVLMKYTEFENTNVPSPNIWGQAPINQVARLRQFRDANYTTVVKGNVDTYYTPAWMDLTKGPLVLTVPNTVVTNTLTSTIISNNTQNTTTTTTLTNRYFMLPFMDAYSNVFKSLGTRTTGAAAGTYLIVPPGWDDDTSNIKTENMTRINAPTNMVWMLGRFQVNSTQDGQEVVWPLQDGVTLTPLSDYGTARPAPIVPVDKKIRKAPIDSVRDLQMTDFINEMTTLMIANPYPDRDTDFVNKMQTILNIPIPDRTEGISATPQPWDRSGFSKAQNDALDVIPTLAFHHLAKMQEIGSPSIEKETVTDRSKYIQNGVDKGHWMVILNNIGEYGTHYFQRAFIAYAGLAANLVEDAIYPGSIKDTDGNLLDSTHNYVVTFRAGQLPPVNGFWSLTVYNQKDYLVANSINRYSLGDRSPLVFEDNGDLKIYVQNKPPKKPIPESNWLPSASSGGMTLMLRLYWPKSEVIDCKWNYPTITKRPIAALEEDIPAVLKL